MMIVNLNLIYMGSERDQSVEYRSREALRARASSPVPTTDSRTQLGNQSTRWSIVRCPPSLRDRDRRPGSTLRA